MLAVACSGGGPRASETPIEPARVVVVDAMPPDADPDPDRDRVVGACDLCPDDAETFNGILDEDGCPDDSGASHAVSSHPTRRLGSPIAYPFAGDKPLVNMEIMFDEDVQIIDVIGRSRVDVKPALAARRAALIAKQIRMTTKATVNERVTGATQLYVDDDVADPDGDVVVQVMRGGDVDLWKWRDDQLVRATPRARMPVPKRPAGC